MNKKIAVLAGDGIGPEIMQGTLRVLNVIAQKFNHHFEYLEGKIGGQAYEIYRSHCPVETLQICHDADAILFGSVGGPVNEQHLAKWKNCELNSILKLRQHFNLNINIRPIKVYPALITSSPLKAEVIHQGVDYLIFRELSGGLYFGQHEQFIADNRRSAKDECIYLEEQILSIAHAAFKAAMLRTKKICSVDKANVLATSKLWREVFNETAKTYPEVQLTHMLIDNCVMQMIINPCQFDVVVTENMFGDIISDLAAALPGSLGLIPSVSLNKEGRGLYEPSGGSAPDIAGKGIANPCAQILSAAMMLRYSFGMNTEAAIIEKAVQTIFAEGIVTKDLLRNQEKWVTSTVLINALIANINKH
ncbi:MAG: 3-isopropylmalate dehydrogenase [Gammaproteobacteria bacterium RIFCSPHIGHO2_12_FULL_35_23]|nr:MAG: 3-isopropylmalate dehydrogenase [Gammaproteobacteria bacterium RIFCSPHIGHO2_12_FULL_35_23]